VGEMGTIVSTADGGTTWSDHSLGEDVMLYDVEYSSPDHAWIVGEYGTIVFSSDGGATWDRKHIDTISEEMLLLGVFFKDVQEGWITGVNGTIFHTRDGGATWAKASLSVSDHLLDLIVFGSNGWAVGLNGCVVASHDGGETWEKKECHIYDWISAIDFDADKRGVMVGGHGIALTTDSIATKWEYVK
ncbi:MAG TPA: YCF48-related protein, partial [Thermodesulfobacteriota bacterium]|nr:YCF48-related protein [Thermodesulfobacteriota bacterium]